MLSTKLTCVESASPILNLFLSKARSGSFTLLSESVRGPLRLPHGAAFPSASIHSLPGYWISPITPALLERLLSLTSRVAFTTLSPPSEKPLFTLATTVSPSSS